MWNVPTKKRLSKIPTLYETENDPLQDKLIYLHFFIAGFDWYIAEFNGQDLFWGYAILNNDFDMAEWGYISFKELKNININGIEIDCELEEFFSVFFYENLKMAKKRKQKNKSEEKQEIKFFKTIKQQEIEEY